MKKYVLILAYVAVIFLAFGAGAEEVKEKEAMIQKSEDTPPGMELIKVGNGQEILVPQGTKIRRIGAQLILQDTSAYFAEKFIGMENHFMKIEESLQGLEQRIKDLEKETQQENKETLVSGNKEK